MPTYINKHTHSERRREEGRRERGDDMKEGDREGLIETEERKKETTKQHLRSAGKPVRRLLNDRSIDYQIKCEKQSFTAFR